MNNISTQELANWIILLGAVAVAITNILKLFDKPSKILGSKKREKFRNEFKVELDAVMPELIAEERKELLSVVQEVVNKDVKPQLEDILKLNAAQSKQIELLTISSLDMLRQNIMNLYNSHKAIKTLTQSEKEFLDDLYRDYSNEGGNSFIEKIYERMQNWKIVDDE